jgi:hypothetical protein
MMTSLLTWVAGETILGLLQGAIEILSARFMLDQQDVFSQQTNVGVAPLGFLYQLLDDGNLAALDAEYLEKIIP